MFNFILFAAILFAVNGHYEEDPKSFKDAQCDVLGICVVCTTIKNFPYTYSPQKLGIIILLLTNFLLYHNSRENF